MNLKFLYRVTPGFVIALVFAAIGSFDWGAPFMAVARAQSEAAFGLTERPSLQALNLPFAGDGPRIGLRINEAFAGLSFSSPLYITAAPGDDSHLYVVEQRGVIRRFENRPDVSTSSVFLDMRSLVTDRGIEEGLLGLAFHPNYASNGRFYVYYSPADGDRRTVVARFNRSSSDARVGDLATRTQLLSIHQPYPNHNGGCLQFGPDGKLYIATGDGGGSDDPNNSSQRLGESLGKILRINDNGSIPSDNPFVGVEGAREAIWAYGLRNPWRFSFDKATGKLWLGDVGQNHDEEVNVITRGGNYGWRIYEGNRSNINPDSLPATDFQSPVFVYPHESTGPDPVVGASITGGYIYRGSRMPSLVGKYVFADFLAGRVWALTQDDGVVEGVEVVGDVPLPASFGEDNSGNLYIVSLQGSIYRIDPAEEGEIPQAPTLLSETGLFASTDRLTPNPGLIEYEIRAPFWSDGALKRRWIGVPDDTRIGFSAESPWTWPAHSVVVKHFEIALASGVNKRLETRVFVNTDQGWRGYTYRWNDAETDAVLLPDARSSVTLNVSDPASPTGSRSQVYVFPSRADCVRCHTKAAGVILGPRTAQMNRDAVYPNGVRDNQLRAFNHVGLFDRDVGSASQYQALTAPADTSATLQARARAYLDSNCSQCHRPGGPTRVSLDFRSRTPNAEMNAIGVRPITGSLGIFNALIVTPGNKSRSTLWERMRRLDDARMPPVGSHRVDAEGVSLIGQWIDSLQVSQLPSVSFTVGSQTATESTALVTVNVQLSSATEAAVTVPIAIGGTSTSGEDYNFATSAITIAAGETRASRTVAILDDSLDEAVETIVFSLGTPTNATLGSVPQHILSISDDDPVPTVRFSTSSTNAAESMGSVDIHVELSAASGREVSVPLTLSGTAQRSQDFQLNTSELTLAPGVRAATLRLALIDDDIEEPSETVVVQFGTPSNADLGSITRHTLTIQDDDHTAPTIHFAIAGSTVDESIGLVRVQVELSAPATQDVIVPIALDGSANRPLDYETEASSVVIPAGAQHAMIELRVVDDILDEASETVTIKLAAPSNAILSSPAEYRLEISDDDAPPTVSFGSTGRIVAESNTGVVVHVKLSAPSGRNISVPVIFGGNSQPTLDYSVSKTTVRFPAGSQRATFRIYPVDDSLDENDESVTVALSSQARAGLGEPAEYTLQIADNDPSPTVSFLSSGRTVGESAGSLRVRVKLSEASGRAVLVPIELSGTAAMPSDYAMTTPNPLRIPPGRLFADARIQVMDDTMEERVEAVILGLGTPTNANLGELTSHRIRIRAND